jgi:putative protease
LNFPELLAPAGDMERLKIALAYGADAVYLGGKNFGLRAFSENFSRDEMSEACRYAHDRRRKVYVTVNMFPHNADMEALPDYLKQLGEVGCDAILVADPGVFRAAKNLIPEMPVHISTQANTTNWQSALFWQEQGARRIVLARELSLHEIREIREKVSLELECFVHGAMCVSYSGRCLMSAYMTGREANRGECAQPCRWRYALMEEKRPGEYFPVEEDERGTYILNSRDLCLLEHLPALALAGVQSFKIEGRMKSVHYLATVVRVYREALDLLGTNLTEINNSGLWTRELEKVASRGYTTGFFDGVPDGDIQEYDTVRILPEWEYAGLVREWNASARTALVEQRNHMRCGDEIEILRPAGTLYRQTLEYMTDTEGNPLNGVINEITDTYVKMDFNHPMAGLDLFFTGKIVEVRDASDYELSGTMNSCSSCGTSNEHGCSGSCG